MKLPDQLQNRARGVTEFFEDQWFDRTRGVRTAGNVPLNEAGITRPADSELYVPARPWQVRQALRRLPLRSPSDYTYVDLGSGKGRTLFIAAELPFREVIGVEFSPVLHARASENVAAYRSRHRRCRVIRSLHLDAADFAFPAGPLVLYLFNPFGARTMQRVLENLTASLRREPRHLLVVLLWPRCGDQVAGVDGMRMVDHPWRWLQVFEAHPDR